MNERGLDKLRNRFVGKRHDQEIKPRIRRFVNKIFQRQDTSTREWDSDEYEEKIVRISRTRIAILFIGLQNRFWSIDRKTRSGPIVA